MNFTKGLILALTVISLLVGTELYFNYSTQYNERLKEIETQNGNTLIHIQHNIEDQVALWQQYVNVLTNSASLQTYINAYAANADVPSDVRSELENEFVLLAKMTPMLTRTSLVDNSGQTLLSVTEGNIDKIKIDFSQHDFFKKILSANPNALFGPHPLDNTIIFAKSIVQHNKRQAILIMQFNATNIINMLSSMVSYRFNNAYFLTNTQGEPIYYFPKDENKVNTYLDIIQPHIKKTNVNYTDERGLLIANYNTYRASRWLTPTRPNSARINGILVTHTFLPLLSAYLIEMTPIDSISRYVRAQFSTIFYIMLITFGLISFISYFMVRVLTKFLRQSTVSKNYLNEIMQTMSNALFVLDNHYTIKKVNQAASDIIGLPENALLGQSVKNILPNAEELLRAPDDKTTSTYQETTLTTHEGRSVPVLFSSSHLNNKTNNLICVVQDISELKKLQSEAEEQQAQLIHAGRLASLGEMATGVAHELNQPLSIIRTNMQSLDMHLNGHEYPMEDVKSMVTSSIKQTDRASNIIKHMRAFARKDETELSPIDLREPIQSAVKMFYEQFRLHNIKIDLSFDENIPLIQANAQQFEQIMVNLLSNARYAVDKKGNTEEGYQKEITIALRLSNDNLLTLTFKDNGIGMDEATLQRCMDPFFTTKTVGEGTGLGLSIVYNMIKHIKGEFHIESTLGEGTCITIMFKGNNDVQ